MSQPPPLPSDRQRWWDLPAALLLMVALLTAASRLVTTEWTVHLGVTQTLVFFGLIAGFALGKSRFSTRWAFFLAGAYGLIAVPWQLGLTLRPDIPWLERMFILINRLGIIIFTLLNQDPVRDSLLFLVLMGFLFWFLAVHAGYTLVRYGNPWMAVLPSGLALFVIQTFDPLISRRAWYLAVFIFFSLVIAARMAFLQHQARWQKNQTALPPHLGFDYIRSALIFVTLVVLFAWTMPALARTLPAAERAWAPVKEAWDNTRDRFENAFASLRSTMSITTETYGPSALLGRGNPLADTQIFSVRSPAKAPASLRYYWRARTYDQYENGRWLNTEDDSQFFDPENNDLKTARNLGRYAATFDVISAANASTLFAPAYILWINRPGVASLDVSPEDSTVDIVSYRASPSLETGESYRVQSAVSNPTIAQLTVSNTEYPEWIKTRYLQLPDAITPRTRLLAQEITAGAQTPYEKTVAITEYLRNNITYVDTIEAIPPTDQEIIDWFLFDYKQGFCNYYATAQVILLRSIGIPARWSVGFAQGERFEGDSALNQGDTFVVRQKDAHSWPEVYFQGIGWVEFEPTASQPLIVRLPGDSDDPASSQLSDSDEERLRREMEEEMAALRAEREALRGDQLSESQQNQSNVVYWLVLVVLAAGIAFMIWRMRERIDMQRVPILLEATLVKAGVRPPEALRRWSSWARLPPMTRAYLEINHALRRMGTKPAVYDTPAERAETLSKLLPPAENPAQRLVYEYQVETFSTQLADLSAARQSGADVRKLSLLAWLRRLFSRLQKPLDKDRSLRLK